MYHNATTVGIWTLKSEVCGLNTFLKKFFFSELIG